MITATELVCENGVVFIYSGNHTSWSKILDPKYCKRNYKTSLLKKALCRILLIISILKWFYILYIFFFVLLYENKLVCLLSIVKVAGVVWEF